MKFYLKVLSISFLLLCYVPVVFAISTSDGFDYPVGRPDAVGYYDAQDFGMYNSDFRGYHLGEDWNKRCGGDCDLGDPIYSISNGTVILKTTQRAWGNILIIQYTLPKGDKYNALYGHFQNINVEQGGEVLRGQQIGTMGKGDKGRFIAHLHFEIRSDLNIGVGPGYSSTSKPTGWVDPSDFISSHRPLVSDPITLASSNTTSVSTTLSWNKPTFANFDHYELYRSAEAGGTSDPAKRTDIFSGNDIAKNIDTISFTDNALVP
ncbi:hypothetical protein COY62_01840, partial [bacterium (Candidatus Howlettbacteria) CG_4_10_14_0_8_um_filter_40_9]